VTPAEAYAGALAGTLPPPHVRFDDGSTRPLPLGRFVGPATAADEAVLRRAAAPVLDVGCGPGRHVRALARRGVLAVGIDISPAAVRLARERGAAVVHGSVFARVPGAGAWRSALLLDGNVGIGGDPRRLLARVERLLAPDGRVLVETDPPGAPTRVVRARLETPSFASDWFAWALVGADGIGALGAAAGLRAATAFSAGGRWFAELRCA
jgi:SAM-dependent methyltransferase